MTRKETFRVKPYAHLNYKFVVRAKLDGKWRRSYFKNEEEARAYAHDQNAAASRQIDGGDRSSNVGQGDSPSKTLAGGAPNQRLAISSATGARKAVVILGMHRSGTSALCGALELIGLDFGKHLMPANDANIKGYWEHEEIVRLHDHLLASLGSRWDDDKPLPSDWDKREITRDVRSLLIGILQRDFAQNSLFGIKDPRMCRLMPLWFPIFQTLRIKPHYVLVVRHPWEIAESLAKRDGIEHPQSYLLWLEHVAQAESATRSYKRSFVRYEELIDKPVAILGELRKQLGVDLRTPAQIETSLRNFLDPSLRHHQLDKRKPDKLRPPVPQLTLDLYETIRNASTSREISRKLEPLVAQFIRGRELFYPRIDLVEAQLGSLITEIAKSKETRKLLDTLDTPAPLSAQLLELNRTSDENTKRVLHLQEECEEKSKQLALLKATLEEKSQRAAQLKAEAEERSGHAVRLQGENEQQTQLLKRLTDQLEISNDQLACVRDEVLDSRSEVLSLRRTLAQSLESAETSAWRVLELESRLAAASSEGDQLRTMPTSLAHREVELAPDDTLRRKIRATEMLALKLGVGEKSNPNPLFDAAWYLANNPDVASAKLNPLAHYCEWGVKDGRDPSPLFSTNWYLAQNPDVAAAGVNPLSHYLEHGARERRDPHPLFETNWYLAQNPEVRGLNPLEHYLRRGCHHRRSPHPLFDATWYLSQYDDIAGVKIDPVLHYLDVGWREDRDPHPLFDSSWYLEQNPDLGAEVNPLRHYLEFGGVEGRDPHPLFDSKWYLQQDPAIDGEGVNPLKHYILHGAEELRSPHPLFDSGHYRATYLNDSNEKQNPLVHYLTIGWRLGYKPNRQFDPGLYLHVHPDVAEAGIEPFTHYILSGRKEGRISTADEISFKLHRHDFEIPREPAFPPEDTVTDVKAIAFYLPQFHQIPENDEWWGEGFTEWFNVRRGHPNFEGHYQPHVPSALGYYDLSEEGVLEKQTQLARQAGIHAFCYYYYWFGGQILLDLPIRRMVETGKPDFPFCICWANENWTRRWDGKENEILIAQKHSPDDDLAFIKKIEPVLRLRNYIRVEGKPMLLIYRPSLLPDAKATLERWRSYARKAGLGELHLVIVYSFSEQRSAEFYGFDAAVQFPPHLQATPVTPRIPGRSRDFTGFIYDYTEVRRYALEQFAAASAHTKLYPGVMPSWDNTARQRTGSTIWVNSSPEAYYEWLAEASRLVRTKSSQSDRLVFINAWNEWAEGCHLEPDERYGYAWLNATSLALRQSSLAPVLSLGLASHPEPPPETPVVVQPLTGPIRLIISVLFYHREDILTALITNLLPQVRLAAQAKDLSCELFLSFNYEPSPGTLRDLQQSIAQLLPSSESSVHIIENRFNLGFGAGHNAIFEKTASDVFIILNSDLHLEDEQWLTKFADRFRNSDVAILGLAGNASRLREDGCGIPVGETGAFDFVDGSALAVRSDLAARFGLFAPSFDYFYFEDVDLNLRYRQMGLRIETLDLPCLHERSSSTRLLPKFAVESVLNRNRARFFERWGRYLTTRCLTNRLALRFREADRQLQCASLAAVFGLLAEHPTAVLDVWGVHQQVGPLFRHPRIRLMPWWQTPREEDYLRSYELSLEATNRAPWAVRIAGQMLVEPAFALARGHLESLLSRDALEREQTKGALIYLARPQILFEGKQPEAENLLAAQEALLQRGFDIQYYSEYGSMEVPAPPPCERKNWKYVAWSTGLDLLTDLALADVLVTTDGWAAELGQLLDKKTMIWLGATSAESVIWNSARTQPFVDPSLSCLGCHERFGHVGRNVCLRGDEACMSSGLNETFVQIVEKFLDGERVVTSAPQVSSANAITSRIRLSDQEKLEAWPQTSAGSVLVLTPVNPALDPAIVRRARELAERAISGMRGCRIVYDDTGEAPLRGQPHPRRQAAIARIRQDTINRHLRDERWVFWVDADLVDYPANLLEELISRAEGGIAAPLVLMEGDLSEPAYPAGFGPGRFYDIAGFIEKGRWARFIQPYFDQIGPVYELDSVGSCYLINADLYRGGAKHTVDHATNSFISSKSEWTADAIQKNQSGPANSYTEHYSVCEFTREAGLPVRAFADLIAFHQKT